MKILFVCNNNPANSTIPADQSQYTADYQGRMGNEFPRIVYERNV
jgi:hypothetical protein